MLLTGQWFGLLVFSSLWNPASFRLVPRKYVESKRCLGFSTLGFGWEEGIKTGFLECWLDSIGVGVEFCAGTPFWIKFGLGLDSTWIEIGFWEGNPFWIKSGLGFNFEFWFGFGEARFWVGFELKFIFWFWSERIGFRARFSSGFKSSLGLQLSDSV